MLSEVLGKCWVYIETRERGGKWGMWNLERWIWWGLEGWDLWFGVVYSCGREEVALLHDAFLECPWWPTWWENIIKLEKNHKLVPKEIVDGLWNCFFFLLMFFYGECYMWSGANGIHYIVWFQNLHTIIISKLKSVSGFLKKKTRRRRTRRKGSNW
jgi:hypothetical protein